MKEIIESEFRNLVKEGKSIEDLMEIYGLNHYNIRQLLIKFNLRIKVPRKPKFKAIRDESKYGVVTLNLDTISLIELEGKIAEFKNILRSRKESEGKLAKEELSSIEDLSRITVEEIA